MPNILLPRTAQRTSFAKVAMDTPLRPQARAQGCARLCLCAFLILPFLLVAPAVAREKAPDWVFGRSSQYPPEAYLAGVGTGPDIDAARSSARAEISKVLQTRVVQSSEQTARESTIEENAATRSSGENVSELTTRTYTDEELQGVEIAATWFDKKKKLFYALAVLNKSKTRSLLAWQISEAEEKIQSSLTSLQFAASPLEEIRILSRALRSTLARDALVARKKIVDPVAAADPIEGASRADIERQLDEARRRVFFAVDAGKERYSESLTSRLRESITGQGFYVIPSSDARRNPDALVIRVQCRVSVERAERFNPSWKFYQWQGDLTMTEDVQEKIIASAAPTGEASHLSDTAAKSKALFEAGEALALAVTQAIDKYLLGNDGP